MTSPGNEIYRDDVVPVCLRLVQTSAQSLANGADVLLNWQQVDIDTHDIFDPADPDQVIPPAGTYRIHGTAFVVLSSALTILQAVVMVGNNGYPPRARHKQASVNVAASVEVTAMVELDGATAVGLYANQTSGGALNTSAGGTFSSVFELERLRVDSA